MSILSRDEIEGEWGPVEDLEVDCVRDLVTAALAYHDLRDAVLAWCDDDDNHSHHCAYWLPFKTGTEPTCNCSVTVLRAAVESARGGDAVTPDELDAIEARANAVHETPDLILLQRESLAMDLLDSGAVDDLIAALREARAERDEARRLMVVDFDRADAAEAEVERLDRDGRAVAGRCLHYEARAKQAEAAIGRVRALCDMWEDCLPSSTAAIAVRAAIDGGDE